jgi:hypothetical protein
MIIMTVMPEQQKVDETVESTSLITDKKLPKKIENSSTALENEIGEEENSTVETELDNSNSILESDTEDVKELE